MSPETSALTLYMHDGESVTSRYLSNSDLVQNMLNVVAINVTEATESWCFADINLPIYSIDMSTMGWPGDRSSLDGQL